MSTFKPSQPSAVVLNPVKRFRAPGLRILLLGVAAAIELLLPANLLEASSLDSLAQQKMRFTTAAYNEAAMKVLLDEVNLASRELDLEEKRPIGVVDLTEKLVNSPFMSDSSGIFGTISSHSYHYVASQNGRLSSIVRNFGSGADGRGAYLAALSRKYAVPTARLDTNAALRLAESWLNCLHIDVPSLNNDSRIEVEAWTLGDKLVPLYWVRWYQPSLSFDPSRPLATGTTNVVAMVELVEPERKLLQLRVDQGRYINRRTLSVQDRDRLLYNTQDSNSREKWFTTEACKRAALDAMLAEVNMFIVQLGIPEKAPITREDLTETHMETPFFSDAQGHFGTICTKRFVYAANAGNKLSYFKRNFRAGNESQYLGSIKSRYKTSAALMNTNEARLIAQSLLTEAGVDVARLGDDCRLEIQCWLPGGQFVPLYDLRWIGRNEEVVALVRLLEPNHSLEQLWVTDERYIHRDPLRVPNREKLLQMRSGASEIP